jgi:hypothetical protein
MSATSMAPVLKSRLTPPRSETTPSSRADHAAGTEAHEARVGAAPTMPRSVGRMKANMFGSPPTPRRRASAGTQPVLPEWYRRARRSRCARRASTPLAEACTRRACCSARPSESFRPGAVRWPRRLELEDRFTRSLCARLPPTRRSRRSCAACSPPRRASRRAASVPAGVDEHAELPVEGLPPMRADVEGGVGRPVARVISFQPASQPPAGSSR